MSLTEIASPGPILTLGFSGALPGGGGNLCELHLSGASPSLGGRKAD